MKKKGLLFLLCISSYLSSFAQQPDATDQKKENTIEQKIEQIGESTEDETLDYTTLLEDLAYFSEHPLNLNHTTREELQQLQLLNEFQITNLLNHIERNGKLISIYELQTINGFDLVTIHKILPFVKVAVDFDRPNITIKELMRNGKHSYMVRFQRVLEDQKGYSPIDDSTLAAKPNSRYLGNKNRYFTRYRFTYGTHVSWGFTAEKDPGEEFFKGTQKNGFDFYSAHFALRDIGKLKSLNIGDYQAQFGQGLTFWSGLAFGKSADPMSIKRSAVGLRAYTSLDENLFLRGAAATYKINRFELTALFSKKEIDANVVAAIDTLKRDEEVVITSFQQTGFHRTPAELEDKHVISEMFYGGNLTFKKRSFRAGITAVRTEYGGMLNRQLSYYSQFDFNSNENFNIGFDYNYIFRNFNFFGEISRSQNGGMAYTNGVLISLDPRLSFIAQHRNFQRNYQAQTANPIMESSRPANEQAIYVGITAKPLSFITLTGYYDKFIFPWLRYQVNAPSDGHDYLTQINYTPSKKVDLYGRIRGRHKMKNTPDDIEDIDFVVSSDQTNYRFNVSYALSKSVKLKNRVEFVNYTLGNNKPEKGYLIYQDINYKGMDSPVSFSFRYALFETDTYNSRIYAYENDVLYSFSIPAYYNRGARTYLTARYSPFRHVDLWVRYAQTFYYNRSVISSGLEEIQGNSKSEIKAQLRFTF